MLKQYEVAFIIAGLLIACATLFTAGWHLGSAHVQIEFDSYKQRQTILAQEQAIKAKQQEIDNAKRTTEIARSYEDDIARLNTALRMRQSARSTAMPATAAGAHTTDATGAVAQRTCEGTEFYGKAMTTELMLEAWQDWARKQQFPVQ